MRPMSGLAAVTAAMVAFGAAEAAAAAKKQTVSSGVPSVIAGFGIYHPSTCAHGAIPRVTVLVQPTHGTVTIEPGSWKIKSNNICDGRDLTGVKVFYRSAPGFKGTDRTTVDVSYEATFGGVATGGMALDIPIEVK